MVCFTCYHSVLCVSIIYLALLYLSDRTFLLCIYWTGFLLSSLFELYARLKPSRKQGMQFPFLKCYKMNRPANIALCISYAGLGKPYKNEQAGIIMYCITQVCLLRDFFWVNSMCVCVIMKLTSFPDNPLSPNKPRSPGGPSVPFGP